MAGELDKSFLRFLQSFSDAKNEVMIDSEFIYTSPICLHPTEKYTQITNLPYLEDFEITNATQIANDFQSEVISDGGTFEAFNCLVEFLNQDAKFELIDCCENVLLDITDKVDYLPFIDSFFKQQIAFTINEIEEDFYFNTCYLRFSIAGYTFYSNGFYVTAEEENKTFRLDYKNVGYYQGISYDKVDIYQSIRLFGYLNQTTTKDSVTIYTQLNGKVRRSRPIQGIEKKYNIDLIDTFTFERLAVALNSQILYLNNVRYQTIDNVQSDERHGKSNLFSTSFNGQFDYADLYYGNEIQENPLLSLTDVVATDETHFNLFFVANFSFLNIYYQIKPIGSSTWGQSVLLNSISSPQNAFINLDINDTVRLHTQYNGVTIYSNEVVLEAFLPYILITSAVDFGVSFWNVYFESNFDLPFLSYQTRADSGSTWSTSTLLGEVTSPAVIDGDGQVRLISTYNSTTIYSNIFDLE